MNIQDARQLVKEYVTQYNNHRLHSAIGYIMPKDKIEGREVLIFAEAERRRKLQQARERGKKAKESVPVHPQIAMSVAIAGG